MRAWTAFRSTFARRSRGAERGAEAAEIEKFHTKLLQRRVASIAIASPGWPHYLPDLANAILLQQVLVRRAERLTVSCGTVLADQNDYGVALLVRGLLETAAVLGYACSRAAGLTGDFNEVAAYGEIVKSLLFGSRDEADRDVFPRAVNIMTCIDKTDAYMATGPRYGGRKCMREMYDLLSEYAHPNMPSHSMGMDYRNGTALLLDRAMDPDFCRLALGGVKLCLMLVNDLCDDLTDHLDRINCAASA